MCGIYGYIGASAQAESITLAGLKRLEYRGYDSWGIASLSPGHKKLNHFKTTGKISQSEYQAFEAAIAAIGHTRWATHGGVTDFNAHPHLDESQRVAVAHNGIIENLDDLHQQALSKSIFVSQTDTERFLRLLLHHQVLDKLHQAVILASQQVEGLNAFVTLLHQPETIIAIKNGSPLVVGHGADGYHLASDVSAFPEHVDQVTYLEDGQLVVLNRDEMHLYDLTGSRLEPQQVERPTGAQTVTKLGYDHFMLKEMTEQPDIVEDYAYNGPGLVADVAEQISRSPRVNLVGCGTAYHACLFGQYLWSNLAKPTTAIMGSEANHFLKAPLEDTLSIFLSQSGETADIVDATKQLKQRGFETAALVNVAHSSLDRLVNNRVLLNAGSEVAVVSTKAFVAKLAALLSLKTQIEKEGESVGANLNQAAQAMRQILHPLYRERYLLPVVELLIDQPRLFILGRGMHYPLALEAALKLKEASYLHAEAFAGGQLKHGVIALIEDQTPCLVFAPQDSTRAAIMANATEVKARGGTIVGVAHQEHELFDYYIPLTTPGSGVVLEEALIGQLLAYQLAVAKDLDPDKPRNLAKSVTVR